jgi:MFS transporter, SP family, major inositol transporter
LERYVLRLTSSMPSTIVLGLAVGGASTVVPVYLAELAPFEIRGSITGRKEMAIVIGQFAAFTVNAILNAMLGHVEGLWRLMSGVCALPAIAQFIGMLRTPESPRWLIEKGREQEALAVLNTVRSEDRALAEFAQVEIVAEEEKAGGHELGFKDVLDNRWLRRIVLVGIGCRGDAAAHRHQYDHVLRAAGAGAVRIH